MIRGLIVSALPILGLGLAATTLAPSLMSGPRGEPLIMASAAATNLQTARFEGTACASRLLFADEATSGGAGTHIVAFALRSGANDVAVEVEDFAGAKETPKTIALVFDNHGRLLAAGDPAHLHLRIAAAEEDCNPIPAPDSGAPI
jgi:hypothetical protein